MKNFKATLDSDESIVTQEWLGYPLKTINAAKFAIRCESNYLNPTVPRPEPADWIRHSHQ
jgi:hypothetical protein